MKQKEQTESNIDADYKLIPMGEITDEARKIAVRWYDGVSEMNDIREKHKLASDIMNYARRFAGYQSKQVAGEWVDGDMHTIARQSFQAGQATKITGWVKVSERLPALLDADAKGYVLAYLRSDRQNNWVSSKGLAKWDRVTSLKYTHWMQLYEPTKDESQQPKQDH